MEMKADSGLDPHTASLSLPKALLGYRPFPAGLRVSPGLSSFRLWEQRWARSRLSLIGARLLLRTRDSGPQFLQRGQHVPDALKCQGHTSAHNLATPDPLLKPRNGSLPELESQALEEHPEF